MALTVKSIRDPKVWMGPCKIERGNHSVWLHFEAGEHRYHVWLQPVGDRDWKLGPTLYRNPIADQRRANTTQSDPRAASNRNAIDYVLRMAGAGEGDMINSAAINGKIEQHNADLEAREAAALAESKAARAAAIRAALTVIKDDGRIKSWGARRGLADIVDAATDDELNKLDALFYIDL